MQPQIAPNTGNVARLCVAGGARLHLVRPLGFVLSDRKLKRSAMDYWPRLDLTVYDDDEGLYRAAAAAGGQHWLFTSKAARELWTARFALGDWLLFGNETSGLPEYLRERDAEKCLRIPQVVGERCLNLATAAAVGLYEAMRQLSLM
jgi:tRNA (cytidine/uridine-2'-O-)-methyltransferase